jgi:DNA repair protein RecO (recombination protein O)
MPKEADKAIFLHRVHFSESSLIATFYTLKSGVQKFIFAGGKKKPGGLFPLALSEINYYKRPDSELGKLTHVAPYEMLHELSCNTLKSTIAFFLSDVLKQCLRTDQPDPSLFHFVEEQILLLDQTEDVGMFIPEFLLHFVQHMGLEPSVEKSNKAYFYLQDGEFSDLPRKGEIFASGETARWIQQTLRAEIPNKLPVETKRNCLETMLLYYKLHIPNFNVDKSLEISKEIIYS